MPDYSGGWARTTVTRTWCCAGCATRRSTRCGASCWRLGLGDAGAHEITDNVSLPRHRLCKLGITSSMGLNAPSARSCRDGHQRPALAAASTSRSRLPQRLLQHHIAEHRVLRRVDQGRRAHGARLRRPHRRQLRRRRGRLRPAPEGAPARQARAGRRREVAAFYERERTEGEEFNVSPAASAPRRSRTRSRELALPVEFGLETMDTSSTGRRRCRSWSSAVRASARSDRHARSRPLRSTRSSSSSAPSRRRSR